MRARQQVERFGKLLFEALQPRRCADVSSHTNGSDSADQRRDQRRNRLRDEDSAVKPAAAPAATSSIMHDRARRRPARPTARSAWPADDPRRSATQPVDAGQRALDLRARRRSASSQLSASAGERHVAQPAIERARCAIIARHARSSAAVGADAAASTTIKTTSDRQHHRTSVTPSNMSAGRWMPRRLQALAALRPDAGRAEPADDLAVLGDARSSRTRRSPAW